MRVSLSWLREHVEVSAELTAADLEAALVRVGLEVEEIVDLRTAVTGPLVVGQVRSAEPVPKVKKPIRYCRVDIGEGEPRGIICGAPNFVEGDLVAVALPGAVLPGDFAITARKTYGRMSEGMICSGLELGVSDDHDGILVLPAGCAAPGTDARALVGLDDVVVELAVTPDRGYCLSARGIARELAHSLGVAFRDPAGVRTPAVGTPTPAYPVRVNDPAGCDRFAARVVRGIDPTAPSPDWMRRRLAVAGVRSISLAVDITNYLLLDLGQPMHAFDLRSLRGDLVVRRAVAGEQLTTLDGCERVLDPEDMVICDAELANGLAEGTPVSLAAVMGGQTSEVVADTVDVLFEAAHWDPVMVARTCRRHKLSSEASKRWERGVDRDLCLPSLELAVRLLTEHGGGTVDEPVLDLDTGPVPTPITLAVDLPARTADVPYRPERVVEVLTSIGCTVAGDDPLVVTPPTWRPDLTDPADLVEEVIRLDGYDRVPSVLPIAPPGGGLTPAQRRRRSASRSLAEAGYVEVLCYPFVGHASLDALGISPDDPRRQLVRLRNPIAESEPAMRPTLLPSLLAALRRNIGRGQRDVALFEIGRVFHPGPAAGRVPPVLPVDRRPTDAALAEANAVVPAQPWHVAVVVAGETEPAGWFGSGRRADWADAVEAARIVAAEASVELTVQAATYEPWHPGRCARLLVGEHLVGHAGELHPAVCATLDLPRRTCAMELNLDALPLSGTVTAPAISTFPPALIDLALVVDRATPTGTVERAIAEGAGPLLESVRLFDVYAGAQLGEGRKSLAYNLTFRAPDRTLTVEEAVAARDAAVATAADRCGAALRGT
ncbi:MAG: phenylalanine--tRNA ligase subunit beta [Dactylosporangium sp.]|nr:phenylalanine--tRNA ligase subunit beta [Dactylosporangium sp.]NNJ60546.1 phenylalanine--tRNA ligase subunit beta [Dactylosporangium sp.]